MEGGEWTRRNAGAAHAIKVLLQHACLQEGFHAWEGKMHL